MTKKNKNKKNPKVLVGTCRHQAVNWSRYIIVTFQYRYWLNLQY